MCLLFVAIAPRPDIQFALVANRDEFYARPTDAAQFRPEHPDLLAGWDRLGGGTWLGLTRAGRVAALTNVRDPSRKRDHPPSRGTLVRDFLLGATSPDEFCARALASGESMLGFNLICGRLGSRREFLCCSNASDGVHHLAAGLYGLSNAQLDTPWPKVSAGKARVSALLHEMSFGEGLLSALDASLRDTCLASDDRLPDTGVGKPMEKLLSPMFIRSPDYGTRSTTAILVHRDGRVLFQEVTHLPANPGFSRVQLEFSLPGNPPQSPFAKGGA